MLRWVIGCGSSVVSLFAPRPPRIAVSAASSPFAGEHGSPPGARPCPSVPRLLRLSGTDSPFLAFAFAVDLVDGRAQRLGALHRRRRLHLSLRLLRLYTRSRDPLSPSRLPATAPSPHHPHQRRVASPPRFGELVLIVVPTSPCPRPRPPPSTLRSVTIARPSSTGA
ncbi:hypothetical protein C8R45DRAFT_1212428 [Mycena sanguinolenta]|nr:hypothetical protein C8R45DRAFT_1212428 [Mycena sanguinolenta]